mmetsp:Transcript_33816/g.67411  ORF Transcript_33816/g.67411 Transcript_33816/m.67411 type:complete len:219 (+) Transcript_33816:1032-1688(+)
MLILRQRCTWQTCLRTARRSSLHLQSTYPKLCLWPPDQRARPKNRRYENVGRRWAFLPLVCSSLLPHRRALLPLWQCMCMCMFKCTCARCMPARCAFLHACTMCMICIFARVCKHGRGERHPVYMVKPWMVHGQAMDGPLISPSIAIRGWDSATLMTRSAGFRVGGCRGESNLSGAGMHDDDGTAVGLDGMICLYSSSMRERSWTPGARCGLVMAVLK